MTDHDDLQNRLRALGSHPIDPARQSADLTGMASLRPAGRLAPKLRVAGAFLAGLLIGGTGLAAANALPDPAQHVAHTALASVGVDVPNPARYHDDAVCGPTEKKNHGAYVRDADDKQSMAQSNCGKPVKSGDAVDEQGEEDAPKLDKPDKAAKSAADACHGKPPWAGDKALSDSAKADAQAEREAVCGPDDEVDELDEVHSETGIDDDQGSDDEVTETPEDDSTTTTGAE